MTKMPLPWIAYATITGHSFFVEVTNNAATSKGVMFHLRGVVYSHVANSEALGEYLEANELYTTSKTEALVRFIQVCAYIAYKFSFDMLYDNEAWAERLKLPIPTIEGMWKSYLDGINGKLKQHGRSLVSIDPEERIEITEEWIAAWAISDHENKQQLVNFGKEKLHKLTQIKLE